MSSEDRPWYAITHGAGMRALKHMYREEELPAALRMYRYVRRDIRPDLRIDLRWADSGLPPHGDPFDGQIWKGDEMVVQRGAPRVALLLHYLREAAAELEPTLAGELIPPVGR